MERSRNNRDRIVRRGMKTSLAIVSSEVVVLCFVVTPPIAGGGGATLLDRLVPWDTPHRRGRVWECRKPCAGSVTLTTKNLPPAKGLRLGHSLFRTGRAP